MHRAGQGLQDTLRIGSPGMLSEHEHERGGDAT
jgi:hypothetical protein